MIRTELRRLIRKAADLLHREAQDIQDSCKVNEKKWACADCDHTKCISRKAFEELRRTGTELRAELRRHDGKDAEEEVL